MSGYCKSIDIKNVLHPNLTSHAIQARDGKIDGLCDSVVGFIGKAVRMMDDETPSGGNGKIKDLK